MKRRFLIGLISLVFILFLIGFVSTWVDNGNSSQSVDGCNQLNTTGATYILTQNVSSNGTCFTITRPNITLDCNGYWINYSINGLENTYGVYTNQLNTTIKNCNIVDGNWTSEAAGDRRGIYLKNVNGSTIFNNYIRVNNSAAIMLEGESSFNNVTKNIAYSGLHAIDIQGHNNIISNNFANSSGVYYSYSSAMIIFGGQNNTLLDNTFYGRHYGLYITNFANNTFGKNLSITGDVDSGILLHWGYNNTLTDFSVISRGNYGISLAISANNTFKDCTITNTGWYDVNVGWDPGCINNTLVNCSYSTERVPTSDGELIRKWYYQAYVNHTNGNPLSSVNISAYNTTGQLQFTTLTNSSGWIPRQEVIEYIGSNQTRRYYSNYTINATSLGYEADSNTIDFTTTKNKVNDVFTLEGEGFQCGELNSANTVYTLAQNVSSQGTCFTITQPNIILDCNGHWINYSINGSNNTYGIYSNQFNTTIKNCNIVEGNFSNPVNNKHGIYLYGADNSTIFNNYINIQSSHPIDVRGYSKYTNITKNTVISNSGPVIYLLDGAVNSVVENNTVISNGSAGIFLYGLCNNCAVINNNVSNIGEGSEGIYVVGSNDVFLVNNTVTGRYTYSVNLYHSLNTIVLNQVAYGGKSGLNMWDSNNSIIKDCINLSGYEYDVHIPSTYLGSSINNTFINCSYDSNKEYVDGDLNNLTRKWYYRAYVNNTEGSPMSNVNITAYNSSGDIQFTTLTNPSGLIDRQEVTEYVNRGGTRSYYNNYIINATSLGYETDSNVFNFTTTQNKLNDVFTLQGEGLHCGELNSANTVYALAQNVSSIGTCFTITQPNITLDCAGYWINYSINGLENTYGIYTNQLNTTIKNCNIVDGNWTSSNNNRFGIYLDRSNFSKLYNNFVNTSDSVSIYLKASTNVDLTNNTGIGNSGYGIYFYGSSDNCSLTNNLGTSDDNRAIALYNSNNILFINNTAISNSNYALMITSSNNNTFINISAISESGRGIYLSSSNNNNFVNSSGRTYAYDYPISLFSSFNNTFTNSSGISEHGKGVYIRESSDNIFVNHISITSEYAISINSSNNTLFKDCINISGGKYHVYYASNPGRSVNNTFTNCSYDLTSNASKEFINGEENELIRKWYYQTYVNYTDGTAVTGANITAYNSSGDIQFTTLTNPSGLIDRQEVTEYVNTGGTRRYYNNYTINATLSGYETESNIFNFTTTQNKLDDVFTFNQLSLKENTCRVLDLANAVYTLTSNVSSNGTCFTVTQPNITLDCNGYWINYTGNDTGDYFGIETTQFNTIIKNCNIYNYTIGIFFNGADNGTIENNNITIYNNKSLDSIIYDNTWRLTPRASGILIYESANYNTIVNNTAYSHYGRGIYINDANNNIIKNSNGSSYFNPGIQVYGGLGHGGSHNSIINSFGLSEESNGIRLGYYGHYNSIINSTAISNLEYAILADYGEFTNVINSLGNSSSNVGIYFLGILNGNIINSTGFSNLTNGIEITYSSHNNLISNSTGIGHHTGIVLGGLLSSYPSNNNTLIDSNGTGGIAGIRLGGINNTIIRNRATGENEAYHLGSLNDSRIIDCVYTSGNLQDVYVSSVYLSVNNTFLNCSYDDEYFSEGSGEIIRKWYYQAYTNYSNGTAVAGANVTAYNSSGDIQFTTLTNPSGLINRQEVIEYVNTGGTKNYYNNYTINATLSGYETDSNVFNFTTTQNKLDDVFTLQGEFVDTVSPNYNSANHNTTSSNRHSLFSIYVSDNYILHPKGQYIFSTNNSGTWVNDSAVNFTSTPSWANVTKILNSNVGRVVGYRWYLKDNAGNTNSTRIYTLTTTETSLFPYFTYIPEKSFLSYDNQFLGVYFNAQDETGFGYFSTNDTRFPINQSGYLSKVNSLAAGNYSVNVTINNSLGNINWTIYSIQINKSASEVYLYLKNARNNVTISNGSSILINGTLHRGAGVISIYNNNNLLNSGLSPIYNTVLFNNVGIYNITLIYPGNENYTSSYETWWVHSTNLSLSKPNYLLINHTSVAEFGDIPNYWIEQAKKLTLHYAHTSHGGQLIQGANYIESNIDPKYNIAVREATTEGLPDDLAALRVYDGNPPETYIGPEDYWDNVSAPDALSRTMGVANTGKYNISMWSWCGQQADNSVSQVERYLNNMYWLQQQYPNMTFILMTGHLGSQNNEYIYSNYTRDILKRNNDMVRNFAIEHNMTLFDFADIEGHNGTNYCYTNDYHVAYNNTIVECKWPSSPSFYCSHSAGPNCERKGSAFWVMMAKIAGWDGQSNTAPVTSLNSPSSGSSLSPGQITFQCSLTDDYDLKNTTLYVWNSAGNLISSNLTVDVTGTSNSTNIIYTINNEGSYSWNCLTYDGDSASSFSSTNNTLVVSSGADTTPPRYNSVSHNSTLANNIALFSVNVFDETALVNGGFIFSTNNSGTWVNDSFVLFTSNPSWANVTKILNSNVGSVVGYRWYFNDSTGNINSTGIYTLTTTDLIPGGLQCGELNSANTVYTLTQNVSSQGTCFTITQPNITLDCAGYWINYSINGSNNTYGVYSNQFNTTIKNCNIVEGNFSNPVNNKHGIYLYEAGNSTIFNNYINIQSSHPIDVRHSSIYINITKNTVISNSGPVVYLAGSKNSIIENNTVIANGSAGLYLLSSSDNCTLINNNVSNIGKGGDGIYIVNSNDVFVVNNTVTGKYARAVNLYRSLNTIILNQVAYGGDDGLEIWGSNNSIIKDCINLSGNVDDVFISSSYGLSVNNTFINCSYDINKETVNGEENELIRKWYYQAYTNYSNGTAVAGVNISAYNTTGDIQFTTLTNPSGLINRQEVTEYVNRGGTRSYYNNYTINATLFGHETESNIFNFTTTQNKVNDVFTFNPLVPGENACGVLDSPNTVYTLTRNVLSQGTCFTIAADNITLDCNAAWINYSINGENGTYGIYSDRFNTTIKSCKVIDMNHTSPNNERYGVYFSGASNGNIEYVYVNTTNSQAIFVSSNSTNINLINNDAESLNHGIELRGSSKNNLINNTGIGLMSLSAGIVINGSNENTLINNTGIGNYSGILLGDKSSNNNILINNTATSNFSTALLISYSNNNYFISQNATSYNLGGDSVAIRISNSNNSLIKDCLSISGEDYDVYIGDNNVNNTFLNCSYDINKEYLGIRGNLIRKWYYQTYVNYTNGTAVAGANITAYNKAGQIQFTHLTDSLGYIPLKELTDYIGYNGIRNYYSNYSINASKWLYNMESNVFNFTTKGNFVEDFLTLELDTFPPSYGYVGHSSTTAGQKSKFSIKFTDRGALHPYGVYIFSTNNTGTWENDSAVNFTSTPSWANVSVTLNSTVGDVVGYRWYFSDSFGNMNMTPIYKLVTEEKEESGGEGTGGGGGKKETPSQENEDSLYRPSYEVLQRGYETYFRKGDIVQINLSKNGTYLFEIGDINRFTKNLTILFNSGKYPVGLNESLKFDLNNDSFYDLQISVRDITASNSSRINFKEINEEIPASNKPALNQTSLGNKSTINIFGINGEEKESKSVVYFVFVGIIVLALILVACAIFFRFRKAKETSVNL